MGGRVATFVKDVAVSSLKSLAKGATSFVLGKYIPYVGGPLADKLNSLYAEGGMIEGKIPDVPEGFKAKAINTEAQLISLVKKFPEQAMKANLTVEEIKAKAPEMRKGGTVAKMKKGGAVKKMVLNAMGGKVKKPRSAAQMAATAKLVAMNKAKKK
jgi:hypothetical protein